MQPSRRCNVDCCCTNCLYETSDRESEQTPSSSPPHNPNNITSSPGNYTHHPSGTSNVESVQTAPLNDNNNATPCRYRAVRVPGPYYRSSRWAPYQAGPRPPFDLRRRGAVSQGSGIQSPPTSNTDPIVEFAEITNRTRQRNAPTIQGHSSALARNTDPNPDVSTPLLGETAARLDNVVNRSRRPRRASALSQVVTVSDNECGAQQSTGKMNTNSQDYNPLPLRGHKQSESGVSMIDTQGSSNNQSNPSFRDPFTTPNNSALFGSPSSSATASTSQTPHQSTENTTANDRRPAQQTTENMWEGMYGSNDAEVQRDLGIMERRGSDDIPIQRLAIKDEKNEGDEKDKEGDMNMDD